MYVQTQGIKGNGSDSSGLSSSGVTRGGTCCPSCPRAATSPVLLSPPSLPIPASSWPQFGHLPWPSSLCPFLRKQRAPAGRIWLGAGTLGPGGSCQGPALPTLPCPPPAPLRASRGGDSAGGRIGCPCSPGPGAKGCPGGSRPRGAALARDDPERSLPSHRSFPQLSHRDMGLCQGWE